MNDDDDDELIRRLLRGDRDALNLYARRRRLVMFRMARHRTRNDADAEDIVHEAMVRILRAVESVKEAPLEPARWIAGIFRHTVIDVMFRSAPRRHEHLQAEPARDLAVQAPDPDERILLQQTLSLLNPREREVMELFLEGYSVAEIAGQLRIDESTVRYRLATIRAKVNQSPKPGGDSKP